MTLCPKCLARSDSTWHSDNGCSEYSKKFVCRQHDLHYRVCKCESHPKTTQNCAVRIQAKPKLQQKNKKNEFLDPVVFFYSETAHMKMKDGSYAPVIVNYDSHATDSSVHGSMVQHLRDVHNEGSIIVQEYGTISKQNNTKTGMIKLKELDEAIRMLVNDNAPQKMSRNEAKMPKLWRQKYGMDEK